MEDPFPQNIVPQLRRPPEEERYQSKRLPIANSGGQSGHRGSDKRSRSDAGPVVSMRLKCDVFFYTLPRAEATREIGQWPNSPKKTPLPQSKQENRYLSGNAVDYRIGLIARIGLQAVEELEADNQVRKWSVDELKAIRAECRAKLKALLATKIQEAS